LTIAKYLNATLDTHVRINNHTVVDSLSVTFAALADPTRRAILARLKGGPASVSELAQPFRVSQQAVSKHLAYLERANLVQTRRDGRLQIRQLNPRPLQEAARWVNDYRRHWEAAFSRLRKLVESQDAPISRQKGQR
jgi:DNA-binding transcriptional ArsR family regulator